MAEERDLGERACDPISDETAFALEAFEGVGGGIVEATRGLLAVETQFGQRALEPDDGAAPVVAREDLRNTLEAFQTTMPL